MLRLGSDGKMRCEWAGDKDFYIAYHDHEWGRPVHDDRLLFEMLILEGAQAGLSWETILKRRDGYRACFDNFDVQKIIKYDIKKLEDLRQDERIIRNRLKIYSVVDNAKAFIKIQQEFGSFSAYLWGFVDNKQIINRPDSMRDIATKTQISDIISKDLKKRGMRFVGSTIIYAYMQAVGLVDDHVQGCFLAG